VPAGVLVRSIVTELRPELERSGDWEMVHELCEAALERGSSAGRQREVLRLGGVTRVVDSLLAETRGDAREKVAPSRVMPMLGGYRSPTYDECLCADRRPRATHASVLQALCALGPTELRERHEAIEREQVAAGVVFRPTARQSAIALPIDVVPRVLSGCGFDIIRDEEGRWRVLEDNARVPSGVAYAVQYRRLIAKAFPELVASVSLLDPELAPSLLAQMLRESAPPTGSAASPRIVLLTSGANDSAYFEHRMLAEAMEVALVQPEDLVVAGDILWHQTASGLIMDQLERWIAQRTIELSTHPTINGGHLRPQHVDLRVFVYYGADPVVVPPALTRVAPAGTLVVNSSRGGGAKDTWLLA
jgi:glutamate---cysteine ligase / carboxylate-amine ligase